MKDTKLLYQHGTLAMLVPGLFAGTLTLKALLEHGDTGIGTLSGLDGELIIEKGQVYQVAASGKVRLARLDESVPFANVHWADFKAAGSLANLKDEPLQSTILKQFGSRNLFFAVRLTGEFSAVRTRAVAAQKPPYTGLLNAAKSQKIFTAANIFGTLSGYYSPAVYGGMTSPGFHLHFLSADHQFGGHVLAASLSQGDLALQAFSDLQLHLPASDQAFLKQDFDESTLKHTISQAEN